MTKIYIPKIGEWDILTPPPDGHRGIYCTTNAPALDVKVGDQIEFICNNDIVAKGEVIEISPPTVMKKEWQLSVTFQNWWKIHWIDACTCTDKCQVPCKGDCGCQRCHESYQDFQSME